MQYMKIDKLADRMTIRSSPHIIEIDPGKDLRWQSFLATHPDALIFHHPLWLEVLEEAYRYRPLHLACEDTNGQLLGILPLYHTHNVLNGHSLSSLPRTPVAGPLATNDQALALLVTTGLERTSALPGACFQLKMLTNTLDGLIDGLVSTQWRETYQLALSEQAEHLRFGNSRNHAQIKRAVKKAEKQGVYICQAESERDLRDWYMLYLDTMRRVVVPPRPLHFFELAWQRLQPHGLLRLLLAKRVENGNSRTVAGLLLLMYNRTVFYAFSGWKSKDQEFRPNDALHWRAIHDACTEGFRYYDFGEVPRNNPGLAEFKSKWGTERKWLYRYYYPAPREAEISMLEGRSPLYQLAYATWQRLPLKATALLGDLAHRIF